MVVRGFWYQQLATWSQFYTFHVDKPHAFLFSHLIFTSKNKMLTTCHVVKGNYATYELSHEVEKVILETLEVVKLLD